MTSLISVALSGFLTFTGASNISNYSTIRNGLEDNGYLTQDIIERAYDIGVDTDYYMVPLSDKSVNGNLFKSITITNEEQTPVFVADDEFAYLTYDKTKLNGAYLSYFDNYYLLFNVEGNGEIVNCYITARCFTDVPTKNLDMNGWVYYTFYSLSFNYYEEFDYEITYVNDMRTTYNSDIVFDSYFSELFTNPELVQRNIIPVEQGDLFTMLGAFTSIPFMFIKNLFDFSIFRGVKLITILASVLMVMLIFWVLKKMRDD